MSDEYIAYVALVLIGVALVAVVWGLAGIVRGRRPTEKENEDRLGELLRAEGERLRQFTEHQARAMRDIGEKVNALKDTNAKSVGDLQQNLGARIDTLGGDLDRRMKALDERQAAVSADAAKAFQSFLASTEGEEGGGDGARGAAALAALRLEVTSNIDRLQQRLLLSVDDQRAVHVTQLEALADRLARSVAERTGADAERARAEELDALTELRQEVGNGIDRLQQRLSASIEEQRAAQANQLEAMSQRLAQSDAARSDEATASKEEGASSVAAVAELRAEVAATLDRLQDRLFSTVDEQRRAQTSQLDALGERIARSLAEAGSHDEIKAVLERHVSEQRSAQAEQLDALAERLSRSFSAESREEVQTVLERHQADQRAAQKEHYEALSERISRSLAEAGSREDLQAILERHQATQRSAQNEQFEALAERLSKSLAEAGAREDVKAILEHHQEAQRAAQAAQFDALAERVTRSLANAGSRDDVQALLERHETAHRTVQAEQFDALANRLAETVSNAVPRKGVGKDLDRALAEMAQAQEQRHHTLLEALDAKVKELADGGQKAIVASQQETAGELARIGNAAKDTLAAMTALRTQRMDVVKTALNSITERQEKSQDELRRAVEGRLDALTSGNNARLDEMQGSVERRLSALIDERIAGSVRMLDQQFEQLRRALGDMQALAGDFGDLKRVLAGARAQGAFGEVELRSLVSQMFLSDQFVADVATGKSSGKRVDVAIRLPGRNGEGEMLLPIVVHRAGDEHQQLVQAVARNDTEAAETAGRRLEEALRAMALEVGLDHVDPPSTADIAVLYLPSEAMYAEVLRRPGLVEQVQQQHRVVVAGPTTLQAMLNAFRMVIRAVAIQKRSTEVWQLLGSLRSELDRSDEELDKMQQQLASSQQSLEALRSRSRAMQRRLHGMDTLGQDNIPTLLGVTPALQQAAE